jgi:hypothetical protein
MSNLRVGDTVSMSNYKVQCLRTVERVFELEGEQCFEYSTSGTKHIAFSKDWNKYCPSKKVDEDFEDFIEKVSVEKPLDLLDDLEDIRVKINPNLLKDTPLPKLNQFN